MAQNTGIVESHIKAPEVFPRPGDQCLHLHFREHIRGQGQGLVAWQRRDLAGLSVYFIHDLLQFPSTSARHDHAGARSCIGQRSGTANAGSAPRDMVAVPISSPVQVAVVASPDYLERHGTPMTPADLQNHRCINRRLIQGDGLQRWEFMQDGRLLRVSVPGKLVLNDAGLILAAALDGQGLAYSADQLVAEHLTAGRLVRVLADFSPRIEGFCLYYPNRRISVTLRALVEMLKDAREPAAH